MSETSRTSEIVPDPTIYPIPQTVADVERLNLTDERHRAAALGGVGLRLELTLRDAYEALDTSERRADAATAEVDELAVSDAQKTAIIDELTQKSERDPKTGLLHAEAFREKVLTALRTDRRRHPATARNYLLFVDLDNFKAWNTLFTETINDSMTLLPVANIVASHTRDDLDYAARWGGEEFTIFLRNITPRDLRAYAERLKSSINQIETPEQPAGIEHLGASIGIARIDSAEDYETALGQANLAKKYVKYLVPGKDAIMYANKITKRDTAYLKTVE